jgi:hypothetical protein
VKDQVVLRPGEDNAAAAEVGQEPLECRAQLLLALTVLFATVMSPLPLCETQELFRWQ